MKNCLLVIAIFLLTSFKHPFYLSVTDLKYNVKEKALQGSVKIFVNDLEGALKKIHNKSVDLINVKDSAATNTLLNTYLKNNLSLKVNGQPKAFDMIGFERESEAVWIYLEFKNCPLPKQVLVINSILFDFLPDQSNIVHLEVIGSRKSLKANNPEKDLLFEF